MIDFQEAHKLCTDLRKLHEKAVKRIQEGQSAWTADEIKECSKIKVFTEDLITVLWRYVRP